MKTKAQREFLKQRRQYEKQLREKARNDELSLSEKLEWQQISRGRYREKLFNNSKTDFAPLLAWHFLPYIFIALIVIASILRSVLSGLFGVSNHTDNYEDYNYDLIQENGKSIHVVDARYNEIYHAILETSDAGDYLYDVYTEAQADYEVTQAFDIDALYEIDAFYYEHFDSLKDSLFTSLDDLQQNILALAKLEYSGASIAATDLENMKAAIEASKDAFKEQITFAQADLALESTHK